MRYEARFRGNACTIGEPAPTMRVPRKRLHHEARFRGNACWRPLPAGLDEVRWLAIPARYERCVDAVVACGASAGCDLGIARTSLSTATLGPRGPYRSTRRSV